MADVLNLFDNREKAVAIWLVVFVLGALCIRDVRRQVPGLLKILVNPVLLVPFLLAGGYVAGIVYLFAGVGLWSKSLLDVTVFWFLGAGLASFAAAGLHAGDPALFRRILRRRMFTGVLVVEFIANLYVFGLIAELALVLGVTLFVLLDVVAGSKREFASAKKVTEGALMVFGLVLLARALNIAVSDPGSFATSKTVMRFALPIMLSGAFLVVVYVLAVWSLYSQAFARLNDMAKEPRLARFAKRAMLRAFRLDRLRLAEFAGPGVVKLARAHNEREMEQVLRRAA
jgi:hypothetical protein